MRKTKVTAAILIGLATAAMSGCSDQLSTEDSEALAQLARVAGPTSGVEAARVTGTECWLPSEHLIDSAEVADTTWKVLCRVRWKKADGAVRHQDTTCIGDFAADPMLEHCYRWTHYDLMPVFEDQPAVEADSQHPQSTLDTIRFSLIS